MLPIKDDQPRYSTPWVNGFLIGLNLVIFFFEFTLDPRSLDLLARQFGVVPSHLVAFLSGSPKYSLLDVVLPFFTSMFLHGSWMHVIGNVWFLYIFGDNVEDYLGHFKYLVFYIFVGLIAMATQVMVSLHSTVPTLGASGAIAGVLGAYFVLYPRARVLTWFFVFVVWVPAWIILGYWFALQFLSGTASIALYARQNVGGVAFWAHVGGFVAGALLVKVFGERELRYPYARA
ncbi:MAG TPA: rhomboid family intramembrane serine protease [Candidatus Dormibacteraeota bacterium]|jgi:membrane associated rhomboid family serine protease|nr:rhomboid family intramembrane serine protease [Candidatus Dormibacteraeota bacterium]